MNYQIIQNEEKLKEFIEWLPGLQENEVFFVCLQARKKYIPGIKTNDKLQLKRFCANKTNLMQKIRQCECEIGTYKTHLGDSILTNALVVYITPNPRNLVAASFNSIKALVDLLHHNYKKINPHAETLSQIHKAKSRTEFVHFDVDLDSYVSSVGQIYDNVSSIVGKECLTIIETRGGCHILIRPSLVKCETKNWYPLITKAVLCDQVGDLMIPIVGCIQGGFVPNFYKDLK